MVNLNLMVIPCSRSSLKIEGNADRKYEELDEFIATNTHVVSGIVSFAGKGFLHAMIHGHLLQATLYQA